VDTNFGCKLLNNFHNPYIYSMYSTENSLDSITCPSKQHSKLDDIEKLIKNPGRVVGTHDVYSNFYDIYTNEAFSILMVKIPKIDPAGIKFITAFMPDKKSNQLSHFEDDKIDLFNPDIVTDSNYDFSGNNMLYFGNNDKENKYCHKVYLIKEKLDTIFLDSNERTTNIDQKYNSIVETFPVKYSGCCHYYIDIMPYIKNELIKWIYSKLQILNMLNDDKKNDYNNKADINNFINRLDLNITHIQVFPCNIRVGFHARVENFDWERTLLDEMGTNDIVIDEQSSFYIKMLPDDPMVGRVYDRRVGYFTINKHVLDPNSFDNEVRLITKLRIPEAIDYIYKIYVDPVVPAKYHNLLRDMIAKYNKEFLYLNGFNPFKLVTVDQVDFPEDFDRHDLRYPVISLTSNKNTGYWGIANTLVDGRSGEIMWFKMLLNTEITTQQSRMLLDYGGTSASFSQLSNKSVSKLEKSLKLQKKLLVKLHKKNIMPCCLAQDAISVDPSSNEYKLLLQSVMTHEMGHCLGLRHNFAGSIAGNTAQDSESVMDYHNLTQGWIGTNTPNSTPKIVPGVYDSYAIRYGYIMLAGEVTGVKHSSLDGLAAGYELSQADTLPNDVFLENPLNPVFLTDENLGVDPRGNQYDHGNIYEWVTVERAQYETARATLLQNVKDRLISEKVYTQLYVAAFVRLLRGGFDAISKFPGGFIYDLNKITYRTSTRIECVQALQYLFKYSGDYNDAAFDNVDPQLTGNIENFFFSPTEEELLYLRAEQVGTYSTQPLRIDQLQANLSLLVFDKIVGFISPDKISRLVETDKIGEIKQEIYPSIDTTTLASYMSSRDLLLSTAFSPGSVTEGALNPQMPQGTPWLYLSYWAFYQSSFVFLPIVPFAGIYDDTVLIPPPYPIFGAPGLPAPLPLMPTPIPYTSPGIFPEVGIWILFIQQQTTAFRLNPLQFVSHLRNMPVLRKNKRLYFLDLMSSYIKGLLNEGDVDNNFIELINLVAGIIVNAYDPEGDQSIIFYASLPEANLDVEDLVHLNTIYNLALDLINTIGKAKGTLTPFSLQDNPIIKGLKAEEQRMLANAKLIIGQKGKQKSTPAPPPTPASAPIPARRTNGASRQTRPNKKR